MGAELYIESIFNDAYRRWAPIFERLVIVRDRAISRGEDAEEIQLQIRKVYNRMYPRSGYFCDNYNGTCLLWRLGLSWWEDVDPLVKDGYLYTNEIRKLICMVKKAKWIDLNEYVKEYSLQIDDKDNSPDAWEIYFLGKKRHLLSLLNRALRIGEPILVSI
ncbi:MAG: hypothetical protein QW835_00610 [Candidatus Hadarchaeum sp.]